MASGPMTRPSFSEIAPLASSSVAKRPEHSEMALNVTNCEGGHRAGLARKKKPRG